MLLNRTQHLADQDGIRAQDGDDPVRLGALLRAWVSGARDGINPRELRALSEGTSSAGGVLVPVPTAAQFIDRARNASRVMEAGASTVPMDSMTLKVPRITGSTAPAWRLEDAVVATGDMTMDSITLTARSLAFLALDTGQRRCRSRSVTPYADGLTGPSPAGPGLLGCTTPKDGSGRGIVGKHTDETRDCGTCGGSGVIVTTTNGKGPSAATRKETCPSCHGTGKQR